jgi:LacI family transcriptional regulator
MLRLRPNAILFHGPRSMLQAWPEWPADIPLVTACKGMPGSDNDVVIDMDALLRLAVEELIQAGYPHVALAEASDPEKACCARHVAAGGVAFSAFSPDPSWPRRPGTELADTYWEQRSQWLLGLSRPVGVISELSQDVLRLLQTCQENDVAVPDEVGLLSIPLVSAVPTNDVPITTIQSPYRRLGFEGARMLDARLRGDGSTKQVVLQPLGVRRRLSTQPVFCNEATVTRAVRLIRAHIADGINVTDLANMLRMPRNRVHRLFAQHAGCGPSDLIRRIRLASATEMLLDTDLPVSEIARRTGFATLKSFSRAFGAAFKASPSAYRAAGQQGAGLVLPAGRTQGPC